MAADLPELDGVRHSWVDAGGVRIHVAELGPPDAPALVLQHGWPQHWWCWHKIAPALADSWRIVMPDLRGHGWSEAPRGGYEQEQLARDTIGVLDALGIERAGYVGHDWGGYVGFHLADIAPERVSAFLLVSIPHPWPSPHDQRNPRRLASFGYQIPLATPPVGELFVLTGGLAVMFAKGSPEGTFTAADLAAYDATVRTRRGARVSSLMYRSFLLHEVVPVLKGRFADVGLPHPARLLAGEDDPIFAGARMDGYEHNAPQMVVEWVPGAGHFLPEERPEAVLAALREHLRRPA
jgi:pimeloyl-ACP methyl ester carboxylesterase